MINFANFWANVTRIDIAASVSEDTALAIFAATEAVKRKPEKVK